MIRNCLVCYQELEELGGTIADLWTDLCHLSSEGNVVNIKENNGLKYEIQCLEHLGYIVTNETPEIVQVKANGRQDTFFGTCFCINWTGHHE